MEKQLKSNAELKPEPEQGEVDAELKLEPEPELGWLRQKALQKKRKRFFLK